MFRDSIVRAVAKETKLSPAEIDQLLEVPRKELGDFAFPCYVLAKVQKKSPVQIAQQLASMALPAGIREIKAVGPYINFFVDNAAFAAEVLPAVRKQTDKYGAGRESSTILIEYCGPNTNKPLHLGHLRNMAIGGALCRLHSFLGNDVKPVNIVNDRGVHICQSMLAYDKWGKGKKPDKKSDHFVGDYYVLFAQQLQKNPELEKDVQDLLLKWERGDKEVRALWKKMNGWVLKGFAETYKRFGVSFDKEYFESNLYEQGKEVAFEGLKNGVFIKDDKKSIVAPLESYGLSNKVVLRGDGTSVYITQDMYLAEERFKDFAYDKMLYVVASEQKLHFQQLFKILELLQRPFAKRLVHVSYGLVNLPSGRMKSREGTVVDADDIIDEVVALARKEVDSRYPALAAKVRSYRAEAIGLAAIKFYLLKTDAVRDIVYNPEESLHFEGETGPYLQYTHARACSILRKAGNAGKKLKFELLHEAQEQLLVQLISSFPEAVGNAAHEYKPHLLCRHLLDIAQAFNDFYHHHTVISENKELMGVRLVLVDCVRQVLKNGLKLLGIEALEEM
ncbi:MAG TPA: arginine--tRNA ligase [Candidatus Nanoarchaeia archaeon]|nr:arginine--tRNA ligase [Candidatus Nanoarchaeia archaeon]